MKAIVLEQYGGPEQLAWKEMARPSAGPGQVLVRVVATSFNPVDPKRASGNMRDIFKIVLPFVPGGDFSGVVQELGEGVTAFEVGDEVYGYSVAGGSYAQFLLTGTDAISRKPAGLTHEEAASLALVGQTASQAVQEAGLTPEKTVLILGAGGAVGSVAVQLAKQLGARVIAVARAESVERLRSYGADAVIDSAKDQFESLAMDVDDVLDAVGGELQQRAFAVLKPGGVLVALSQPPSQQEAEQRHVRATMLQTKSTAAALAALRDRIETAKLKPYIGRTYPLSEAAQAWKNSSLEHVEGKVVFQVPG